MDPGGQLELDVTGATWTGDQRDRCWEVAIETRWPRLAAMAVLAASAACGTGWAWVQAAAHAASAERGLLAAGCALVLAAGGILALVPRRRTS